MANNEGISRRNVLKAMGGAALCSLIPSLAVGGEAAKFGPNKGKGLIFVVGDGMPLGVVRAMHETSVGIYGNNGTNFYARMKDPQTALGYMGTSSLSSIVTDSAPASAAWSTGTKTINRMLASLPDSRPLKTIMEILREEGYGSGLVTTTRVTHATPAAWISHQMNRDDEDNIALDYLKFRPDVILGGGSDFFDSAKRKDGMDLFASFANSGYDIIRDKESLLSTPCVSSDKRLLGLFNSSHISYLVDRAHDSTLGSRQPTLAEMTAVALHKLSKNPKGFILQVEAGRIDHANHSNDAWASIMDTYELDMTLGVIGEYLKVNPEALVIVTSDHGNAGWGLNGTGPEYNNAGAALSRYSSVRGSFETIKSHLKGKSESELKDIFEHYTSFTISREEAAIIYQAMQPGYKSYPGDFVYQPDAVMGKILAHSSYVKESTEISVGGARRGNVGFTSCNHTGEDQIVMAFGHKAKQSGIDRLIDNTDLFDVMCRYFGVKHKNPVMDPVEAKRFIKSVSSEELENALRLHVA